MGWVRDKAPIPNLHSRFVAKRKCSKEKGECVTFLNFFTPVADEGLLPRLEVLLGDLVVLGDVLRVDLLGVLLVDLRLLDEAGLSSLVGRPVLRLDGREVETLPVTGPLEGVVAARPRPCRSRSWWGSSWAASPQPRWSLGPTWRQAGCCCCPWRRPSPWASSSSA